MRVELLSADHPGWADCLRRLPHDFYHLPFYARLEGRRTQATPEAFLAAEGDKLFFLPYLVRPCAPLFADGALPEPAFDVTSPYGYPGLLLSEAGREPGFAARAAEALRETLRARGVCAGFFRMNPLLNADDPAMFPPGLFTDNGETVVVDLCPEAEEIWKAFREGHQWTISKCRKAGFTARMVPLADYLDEFLTAYRQTMDRVKASQTYYFDREYFQELAGVPEQVFCCVAEKDGTVAAACIFFECGGITQAHLGGTKSEFLSKSPFHLLLHHAALWARSRGSRCLHLGGGVGGANDRLLHFKAGFSPLRFPFFTLRLVCDEGRYRQLVDLRARSANVPPETLRGSSFFPAYRATPR